VFGEKQFIKLLHYMCSLSLCVIKRRKVWRKMRSPLHTHIRKERERERERVVLFVCSSQIITSWVCAFFLSFFVFLFVRAV